MGWPDANQPFEDSRAQRRLPISYILEFFAVTCVANVGKATEKAVNIMPAQQLANRDNISQQLRTSLKSMEKRHSGTFWRLLTGLDNGRTVKGELIDAKPAHKIRNYRT